MKKKSLHLISFKLYDVIRRLKKSEITISIHFDQLYALNMFYIDFGKKISIKLIKSKEHFNKATYILSFYLISLNKDIERHFSLHRRNIY